MRVGLLGNTFHLKQEKRLVTGYGIASSDLYEGFLKYSEAEEIFCIYEPEIHQKSIEETIGMQNIEMQKKKYIF